MMWLTWILGNWRLILIGMAIALLAGLWMRLETVTAQRDAKIAEIESIKAEAEAYRKTSEQKAKEINDGIPYMVEQAKKDAYARFKAKYGVNAACGLRPVSVLPGSLGETNSASGADEASADPVADFAGQCAETTVIATQWQAWARANGLPIQ